MLLNNNFYPIDSQSAFIKSDLTKVRDFYLAWDEEVYLPLGIQTKASNLDASLSASFERLLPLTSVQIIRHLIIPCANGWVAIFNNSRRGTDTSAAGYLAEALKTFAVTVAVVPEFNGLFKEEILPHAGTLDFTLFGPNSINFSNKVRSISLTNEDGNWSFETEGNPLPFEDQLSYKSRKIRDRFNISMLATYLSELGIKAFEEDFYDTSSAVLLERSGSLNPSIKSYSIEEAVRN